MGISQHAENLTPQGAPRRVQRTGRRVAAVRQAEGAAFRKGLDQLQIHLDHDQLDQARDLLKDMYKLENYQREDGSIVIPDVLRPYMGWQTEIRP